MFTKKHFAEIAKAIYDATYATEPRTHAILDRGTLLTALCNIFEKGNPNFDCNKFIDACVDGKN